MCSVETADPILPNYRVGPYGQVARFYTSRCTKLGDSSAVLGLKVGESMQAAGLAVDRTVEGEQIEYSIWMWIAGVLGELNVDLIGWEK